MEKIRNFCIIAHIDLHETPILGFYSFTEGNPFISNERLSSGSAYIRRSSLRISSRHARNESERGLLFPVGGGL